jgi:predicted RecA/RadA family phage recombinase
MALRGVAEGRYPTYTAPSGGVVAGTGLLIGSKFVIPTITVGTDERFTSIGGPEIVEHAKVEAQAWTEGAKIYFDAGQELMTTTAGGNTLVGTAYEAAANPSTTGRVLLGWVA